MEQRDQIPRHGTKTAYAGGCRCPECREGNAKRARAFRASKRAEWGVPRPCRKCGRDFEPKKRNQAYCSRECQQTHIRPDAHGTDSNYGRGCRCEKCTQAHTAIHRKYVQRAEESHACVQCGAAFVTTLRLQKYCSVDCQRQAHLTKEREKRRAAQREQLCPTCGKVFKPGGGKGSNRVYCSYECRVRARRLSRYGITAERFRLLLESQSFKCAICGQKLTVHESHCDHDHSTGAVRGALCRNCNIGIGHMQEAPDLLREAAIYLERAKDHRQAP